MFFSCIAQKLRNRATDSTKILSSSATTTVADSTTRQH